MKKLYKQHKNIWLLLMIIGIGALLRIYKINSPILDLYPTRQEQCAMIARNFFRNGYNIFHPEVDWFGKLDSSWRLEFPLVNYFAALFYSVFGIQEFLGRLVSVFFSLGSIYLIFQFVKKLFDHKTAIYASFLFAISPLGVYFGRVFMPDTAMIFFSIASLYFFYRWIESGKSRNYILAIIMTAFAFLIKLPSMYLCLPLLCLAYSKYRKKTFSKLSIYMFFILSTFPALLWYANASNNMIGFYIFHKSNFEILLQPDFYRRIFESIGLLVLTPIGAFLALFGLMLSVNKPEEYFLHFWLSAIVIYTLIAPEVNSIHYYYQLPFVPIFSIFAAKAITRISYHEIWQKTIFSKINTKLMIWIIMVAILAIGFITIIPFYKWNPNTYRAALAVNALTENGAVVIAGRAIQEAPLYYTDRKGWETNDEYSGLLTYSWASALDKYNFPRGEGRAVKMRDEVELIKLLMKYGADYYFTTNMKIFGQEPDFKKYMYDNFKIVKEEKEFVIFSLKK